MDANQINKALDYIIYSLQNKEENDNTLEFDEEIYQKIIAITHLNVYNKINNLQFANKVDEFINVLLHYARHDYTKEVVVENYEDDAFNSLATAINMLGEELNYSTVTKHYLNDVFNSIEDILLVTDENGMIVSVNKTAQQKLFIEESDFRITHLDKLLGKGGGFKEEISKKKNVNLTSLFAKGQEYKVSLSISPFVRGDNVAIGYVVFARDVTRLMEYQLQIEQQNIEILEKNKELEEKNIRLEQAIEKSKESDRLKSAFLTNLSHEIRTPMNGIIGFAEMLQSNDLNYEDRSVYIEVINDSCKQLLNIVSDILDISTIETGQIELNLVNTKLRLLMNDLYMFYHPTFHNKNIDFTVELPAFSEDDVLLTDNTKLWQVFGNLLNNASKFTKQGYVKFGYSREPGLYKFFVRDTGIGVKPEDQEIIFDRFRQADSGLNREYGGNGLGLSISKAYVERLGGEMWVESESGKGSSFYFTIPTQIK